MQGLFGVERVNDAKPTVAGNQVCLLIGLIFIMWFLAASRAFSVLLVELTGTAALRKVEQKPTVAGTRVMMKIGLVFIMWFFAASSTFSVLLEPHRHRSPEEGRAEGEVADIDTRSNAGSDAVAIE